MKIPYGELPGCDAEQVDRQDLDRMFSEDPDFPGHGRYIRHDTIHIFAHMLRRRLVRLYKEDSPILLGLAFDFPPNYQERYDNTTINDKKRNETYRATTLRRLLGRHINRGAIEFLSADQYIEEIHRRFKRVILFYNLNDNHFIVFEIVLQSDRGRYLKVWDGMKIWGRGRLRKSIPQVKLIIEVFFRGEPTDVYLWEEGDPSQDDGHGCGPFTALTLAYLTYDLKPPAWTHLDEPVARNYLWGCLLKGAIIRPPKQRLTTVDD